MTDRCSESARQSLLLLAWFSPAFPIGAFAFSHGLEWAQECGAVTNRVDLESWMTDVLTHGSGRTDAIFLTEAWRATRGASTGGTPGEGGIAALADLAAALQPGRERHLEATVQGQAFMTMIGAAFPVDGLQAFTGGPGGGGHDETLASFTLPIAVGLCGAAHGIALAPLLTAYLAALVANLSSAAVRLGIVGQTDGQRIIAALHPAVIALAGKAGALTLDDLGSAAMRADLCSLQHETQYSRLFRS